MSTGRGQCLFLAREPAQDGQQGVKACQCPCVGRVGKLLILPRPRSGKPSLLWWIDRQKQHSSFNLASGQIRQRKIVIIVKQR